MNINFRPELHPRNRLGRFREILGSLKPGDSVTVPGQARIQKRGRGAFRVTTRYGASPMDKYAPMQMVGVRGQGGDPLGQRQIQRDVTPMSVNKVLGDKDSADTVARLVGMDSAPASPGVPGRLSPEAKAAQVQRVRDSLLMTKDLPGKGLDAKKTRRVLPPMSPGTPADPVAQLDAMVRGSRVSAGGKNWELRRYGSHWGAPFEWHHVTGDTRPNGTNVVEHLPSKELIRKYGEALPLPPMSPGTDPPQNAQLANASTGDVVRVDNRWWTKEKTGKWQSEDYKENLSAEDLTSKYGRLQTSKSGLSGDLRPPSPQSPGTGDQVIRNTANRKGLGTNGQLETGDTVRDPATGREGYWQRGYMTGEPSIVWKAESGKSEDETVEFYYEGELDKLNNVTGNFEPWWRDEPQSPGTGFDPDEVLDVDDPRIKNYVKDLPLDADGETNGVRIDRLPVGAQFIDGNGKTFTHMGTGFAQGAAVVRDDESGSLYQQDSGSNIAPVIASGDRVEDPANGRTGTYRRSTMTGESSVAWDDTPDSAEFYYEGELVPLPKAPMSPGTDQAEQELADLRKMNTFGSVLLGKRISQLEDMLHQSKEGGPDPISAEDALHQEMEGGPMSPGTEKSMYDGTPRDKRGLAFDMSDAELLGVGSSPNRDFKARPITPKEYQAALKRKTQRMGSGAPSGNKYRDFEILSDEAIIRQYNGIIEQPPRRPGDDPMLVDLSSPLMKRIEAQDAGDNGRDTVLDPEDLAKLHRSQLDYLFDNTRGTGHSFSFRQQIQNEIKQRDYAAQDDAYKVTEAAVAQELARTQRKLARQKPGARDKDLEETAELLETLLEDVSEADPQD